MIKDCFALTWTVWRSCSGRRGSGIFRGTNRCSDCHYPTSSVGIRHYSASEPAAKTSELADRAEKSIWIRHKHEGKSCPLISMLKLPSVR